MCAAWSVRRAGVEGLRFEAGRGLSRQARPSHRRSIPARARCARTTVRTTISSRMNVRYSATPALRVRASNGIIPSLAHLSTRAFVRRTFDRSDRVVRVYRMRAAGRRIARCSARSRVPLPRTVPHKPCVRCRATGALSSLPVLLYLKLNQLCCVCEPLASRRGIATAGMATSVVLLTRRPPSRAAQHRSQSFGTLLVVVLLSGRY